jgi:TP901 family phage tail tape measure protein
VADNSYKVEAEISTSNSVTNLRSLNKAIDETATALRALNTVTKEGEKDLASMVSSITGLLAAYRQAAQAEKELAQAKIATAKASATEQAAEDAHAASIALTATRTAAAAKNQAQADRTAANTANDRLRTENQLANGFIQREAAQQKVTLAQQRYADSQERAKKNELELTDQLSNTRYLLYDVGATYRAMSIGLEAIPVATALVASSYQRDFAQVIRVTESTSQENDALRESLKGIADQLPVAFGELSQIAQLGAQMGIPTAALSDFTDVTAKFVAVTGVAADTASSLFGRLDTAFNADNSVPDFFNKVGASIAKVGAETVATDPEIAAMLNQISSLGASAGFSADQTIGLAAALASVRVQPELARGTLTRLFANLDRDVSSGGKSLDAYAKLLGTTAQQAANLWKTNPSQFFQQMIGGLNQIYKANGDLTGAFDALGVTSVRDVSSLTKLAVGYDVLTKSMSTAGQAYQDGTALDEQAAPVFETVAAKIQVLVNSFQNLADTLGKGALAPLGAFLGALTGAVQGLDSLAKSQPGIMVLINTLLGFSAVAGVFLGLKAVQTFVLAGIVSFQQMLGSTAARAASFSGIIKQLAVAQLIAKGATEQQANALLKEASALGAVTIAAKVNKEQLALLGPTETANFTQFASTVEKAGQKMGGFGTSVKGVLGAVGSLVGGLPGLISLVGVGLVGALLAAESASDGVAKSLGQALNGSTSDAAKAAGEAIKNLKVGLDASGGEGFNFADYGKGLDQIASRAGISIDKMVTALSKGKQGYEDFKKYLDSFAKDQGFKGLDDFALKNSGPGSMGADIYYVSQAMERLSQKSQEEADSSKKVDSAVTKAGGAAADAAQQYDDLTNGTDGATTATDKLDKALKDLNDTIFGTLDKQAALGDSLSKLGEGLQKSGSFGNDENGRQNIKNLEDSLKAAQDYYALQVKMGKLSAEQASAGYGGFVGQLLGQIKAKGGNLGPVEDLANQTAARFKEVLGAATSGTNAPTVKVTATANTAPAVQQVQATVGQIQYYVNSVHPQLLMGVTGDDTVKNKFVSVAQDVAQITGKPVQFILDALTNPASEHAAEVQQYITSIVNRTYSATVDSNVQPAYDHVTAFYNDAMKKLMEVQNYVNGLASTAPTLAKYAVPGVQPKLTGVPYRPSFVPAVAPKVNLAAPADAAAASNLNLSNALNNVNAGYDKQQAAADKAGEKGKKAGKDSADAWKDAGNAIDEATANADDYASRLKQGLDRAFEKQYGVQAATDAYYQKLNDIKKAREDELKQVDDLKDKIAQLNDEMGKDLIDANKAKIEQAISLKYGEGDRAADYGNKAQTALDNAAAKKKEIDADQQQATEIQNGIGLLTGYSEAAIKNRADLRDLEQKQLDMVVAYAKTGASIDQVRAYSQNLNAQFQSDVTQIGFNRAAVQNLTGDLGRYVDVINKVPYLKPTTVTADTTQATDAVNGLDGALDAIPDNTEKTLTLNIVPNLTEKQVNVSVTGEGGIGATSTQVGIYGRYASGGIVSEGYPIGGIVPGTPPSNPNQDNLLALVDGKRPIGIRSGEGIVTEPATKYYGGKAFIDALNQMKIPRFAMGGIPSGGGSGAGAGVQVVELTAEQLAFLADNLGREVKLYADSKVIAETANRGNRQIASEGRRR